MKISIVVPVYNVEKELPRCVESLLCQTYQEIEIILVDDGSPDSCPAMCELYADKDQRVKVIHKTNGGLSDARNFGMEQATGEYILFVDSDDTIEVDTCERFVSCLEKEKVDIVVGECKEIRSDNIVYQNHTNLDEGLVYTAQEYMLKAISASEFYCPVWLNLYRKDFLVKNQLKFAKGLLHEDMEWTPKVFLKNPSIMYMKRPFYNYIIRGGSITRSKNFDKHIQDSMMIYREWKNEFSLVCDSNLRKALNGFLVKCYINTCSKYEVQKGERLKELTGLFLVKNAVGIQERIKTIFFLTFPNIYIKFRKWWLLR